MWKKLCEKSWREIDWKWKWGIFWKRWPGSLTVWTDKIRLKNIIRKSWALWDSNNSFATLYRATALQRGKIVPTIGILDRRQLSKRSPEQESLCSTWKQMGKKEILSLKPVKSLFFSLSLKHTHTHTHTHTHSLYLASSIFETPGLSISKAFSCHWWDPHHQRSLLISASPISCEAQLLLLLLLV